jgi:dihydroorotate dehydrogenase (NAD+) catalytic subunit
MHAKYDLQINPPLMNAAGCLGFWPDPRGSVDLSRLGAFVTNPISLKPRSPARGRRYVEFPGGFLLHTGYPNPGLKAAIKRYGDHWARSPVSVLIHILTRDVDETAHMVQRLEGIDGVMGVEIGLPPDIDSDSARLIVEAALGELPVITRLPFERATELLGSLVGLDITAVSLGPPRGMVQVGGGDIIQGRLYGPAILPQALAKVQVLVQFGLPVIGAGGVFKAADVEGMLGSGTMAVQLDAALWGDWSEVTGAQVGDLSPV